MKNKRFAIFCMSAFALALIFGVFNIIKEHKTQQEGYNKTYESEFRDVVNTIESNHSTITVTLSNKQQYMFVQSTESYLKGDIFNLVGNGDSISKKSFSEDIIVKHNGKLCLFEINKPDD